MRRSHTKQLSSRLRHDGLTIEGKSIAGNETYFRVKELGLALDVGRCPDFLVGIRNLFITHAHVDHALGVPFHAAQRKLQQLPPSRIHVPSEALDDFRSLIDAYERLQQTEYRLDLIGMSSGDEKKIRRDTVVRAHDATHSIPARAWEIIEIRETLRRELRGLENEEIRDRRLAGEEISETKRISRVFYTGDTDRRILESGGAIFRSKILIIECSFTSADDLERASRYRHIHLDDIFEFADQFGNERVWLTHFSLRDRPEEIVERIDRRCPVALRNRIRFAFPPPLDRLQGSDLETRSE
ncbi:MAG: MBL fold metallo-hydrolase [Thermoanaerobaculia bacterium]|nr:MBL fold metallo-hydrolase [Thermoanaerobaculia bacterium]